MNLRTKLASKINVKKECHNTMLLSVDDECVILL